MALFTICLPPSSAGRTASGRHRAFGYPVIYADEGSPFKFLCAYTRTRVMLMSRPADIDADNNNNAIRLEQINKGTVDDERVNNERSIRAGRFLRLNFVLLLLLHGILFTFSVFSPPNIMIANGTTTIIIVMEMRVYVDVVKFRWFLTWRFSIIVKNNNNNNIVKNTDR